MTIYYYYKKLNLHAPHQSYTNRRLFMQSVKHSKTENKITTMDMENKMYTQPKRTKQFIWKRGPVSSIYFI